MSCEVFSSRISYATASFAQSAKPSEDGTQNTPKFSCCFLKNNYFRLKGNINENRFYDDSRSDTGI
jgi:hypothetical protein